MKKKYFDAYKKLIVLVILLGLFTFTPVYSNLQEEKRINDHIEALKDGNYLVRRNAALALGGIGSVQAVEALINTLKDGDHLVRSYSAWALGKISSDKALEVLRKALKHTTSDVRMAAAQTL
jgi:HEAT repeat protein